MEFIAEILKLYKKYSRNTYKSMKVPSNTQRNTLNYVCNLDTFI